MKTIVFEIEESNIEENAIAQVGAILKSGGLVAFPTETVYGLGANALDSKAAKKIYGAKGRPSDNPLIVHVAKMESVEAIVDVVPERAKVLAKAFWPGPLTLVFKKNNRVPYDITGGLDTVAVRMPNHLVALAIIEAGGGYIAAPSANISGRPSPTKAKHVIADMNGIIDAIVDGGMVGIGLESTIVDLSTDTPMILRPGFITKEMLEKEIGHVLIDPAILETSKAKEIQSIPKAPGMKYKHYAPKATLILVEGEQERVVYKINELLEDGKNTNQKIGVIGTDETYLKYNGGIVKTIGSRQSEEEIARNLYSILREFDETDVDIIYSEFFETPQMGEAIMNRLLKAAAYQRMSV